MKTTRHNSHGTRIMLAALGLGLALLGCSAGTPTPSHDLTALPPSSAATATSSATLTPTVPLSSTTPSDTPTMRPSDTPTATATPGAVTGVVTDLLRVRSGPGTNFSILSRADKGAVLTVLARSPDGQWFQVANPTPAGGSAWVASQFLQVQGAPDRLPVAAIPPTPTLSPTQTATATPIITATATVTASLQPGGACAPIPGASYNALTILSGPTDRPAELQPDLNLGLRGYAPTNLPPALIDLQGSTAPGAPQLRGLFGDRRMPVTTRAYQVYAWDWNANARGPLIDDPEVSLLGLQTAAGEVMNTPNDGGNLGDGYVALVLYASTNRLTLKYTREDNVVNGYTLHIENICVEPTLLALYQQMNNAKRRALPALQPGQPFGRAADGEIGVVVRDRGSFMDPRSRKDWWVGQ